MGIFFFSYVLPGQSRQCLETLQYKNKPKPKKKGIITELTPFIIGPTLTFFSYSRSCCDSCSVASPISLCRGQTEGKSRHDWGFARWLLHLLSVPEGIKGSEWTAGETGFKRKFLWKSTRSCGHINANMRATIGWEKGLPSCFITHVCLQDKS